MLLCQFLLQNTVGATLVSLVNLQLHNQWEIITPACACDVAVLIVLLSVLLFPNSFIYLATR